MYIIIVLLKSYNVQLISSERKIWKFWETWCNWRNINIFSCNMQHYKPLCKYVSNSVSLKLSSRVTLEDAGTSRRCCVGSYHTQNLIMSLSLSIYIYISQKVMICRLWTVLVYIVFTKTKQWSLDYSF